MSLLTSMAVYLQQAVLSGDIKVGFSDKDSSVPGRLKTHKTRGGPQIHLGHIPGAGRDVEQAILRRLESWRILAPDRKYEIVFPDPNVLNFIRGNELRSMGYIELAKPFDPARRTCAQWLRLVVSTRKGAPAAEAASWNLQTNDRLRRAVPRSARGGWDLNEMIGGGGEIGRQLPLGFAVREIEIDGRGWLIRRVTYKGKPYDFVVFKEWFVRHTGRSAPDGAVAGHVPVPPKIQSGRKGRPLKKPAPLPQDESQTSLFQGVP